MYQITGDAAIDLEKALRQIDVVFQISFQAAADLHPAGAVVVGMFQSDLVLVPSRFADRNDRLVSAATTSTPSRSARSTKDG